MVFKVLINNIENFVVCNHNTFSYRPRNSEIQPIRAIEKVQAPHRFQRMRIGHAVYDVISFLSLYTVNSIGK